MANKRDKTIVFSDQQANALHKMLRVSPQKLGLVANAIRGKHVDDALAFLSFNRKRISGEVKKVLLSAIANAENNHGMDIDNLYVTSAVVGKSVTMKRVMAMAKGRSGRIQKPYSRLNISLAQRIEESN